MTVCFGINVTGSHCGYWASTLDFVCPSVKTLNLSCYAPKQQRHQLQILSETLRTWPKAKAKAEPGCIFQNSATPHVRLIGTLSLRHHWCSLQIWNCFADWGKKGETTQLLRGLKRKLEAWKATTDSDYNCQQCARSAVSFESFASDIALTFCLKWLPRLTLIATLDTKAVSLDYNRSVWVNYREWVSMNLNRGFCVFEQKFYWM